MKIDDLSVDIKLKEFLKGMGIEKLYPPQVDSIKSGLFEGVNQVIAIPTASGKTLIAILAIFNALDKYGGKAVYLAPLRALASEKFDEFKEIADVLGYKVRISTGDFDQSAYYLNNSDIIILTNEKFDSLIRHQVPWLDEINVIISDEVHLINDAHRGPVLEVVLSLVRRNLPNCQMLALSATINNAHELAEWLDAKLIFSTWRPIKLREGVWFEGKIKYTNGQVKPAGKASDRDGFVSLSLETIAEGGQVLVFSSTRRIAESSAKILAKSIKKTLTGKESKDLLKIANRIRSIGEKTKIRKNLAELVESGVAFHHAGLISSHRKIIEESFKARKIKVLTATTTLSAGLNLPGRRVIIRSVLRYEGGFGQKAIPILEYKQMAGRAGRPKYDPYGEAIIITKNINERDRIFENYLHKETEDIYSKLGTEPALRSHILSFIASEYVNDFESALDMIRYTFYGFQNEDTLFLVEDEINKVISLLINAKMISPKEPYIITPFGKKINELYLDPLSAKIIREGLDKSTDKYVNQLTYLQLLASVPDIRSYNVRKNEYSDLIEEVEKNMDQWLNEFDEMGGFGFDIFLTTVKTAKIVELWLNEMPEDEIYRKYNVASGDLHSLISRFEWLVHSAVEIARIFKWERHVKALDVIAKRIKYGIREELMELVMIPNVGRIRARLLYDAGYKTAKSIMNASIDELGSIKSLGKGTAMRIKAALTGQDISKVEDIIIENAQTSLDDYF